MKFIELYDRCLEESNIVESTREMRRSRMRNVLKYFEAQGYDIATLNGPQIDKYIFAARAGLNGKDPLLNSTLKRNADMIRAFITWARKAGLRPKMELEISPIPGSKKRQPYFTYDGYMDILDESLKDRHKPYWSTAIIMGWHTGARISDVAAAKWPQVDFENNTITFYPHKLRRMRVDCVIPMDPELSNHLEFIKQNIDDCIDGDYIVPRLFLDERQTRTTMDKQFRQICKAAGYPNHAFHALRRGFCTRLLAVGIDAKIIGSMTGQSEQQVRHYAQPTMDAKEFALEKSRQALHEANVRDRRALAAAQACAPTPASPEHGPQ